MSRDEKRNCLIKQGEKLSLKRDQVLARKELVRNQIKQLTEKMVLASYDINQFVDSFQIGTHQLDNNQLQNIKNHVITQPETIDYTVYDKLN